MSPASSQLWIVHRDEGPRRTLARVAGLPVDAVVAGAPSDAVFATAEPPVALVLAPVGDFEAELDFLHRHRDALAGARRLYLADAADRAEITRLFEARAHEIAPPRPAPRQLRELLTAAVAHRDAAPLTARYERERVAARFSAWFGAVDILGLLRALDPSLASLPLLVRGAPGSGRGLVTRYVELFRGVQRPGPALRLEGHEIRDAAEFSRRLAASEPDATGAAHTIRIDEVDAMPASAQRALAEWIRIDASPVGAARWLATASEGDSRDPSAGGTLDPQLVRAFAPLVLDVPAIADDPAALRAFAEQVLVAWTERVGGPARHLADDAVEVLEVEAWAGDRSAVEATLQTALAATASETLDAAALEESRRAFDLASAPLTTTGRETRPTPDEDAGPWYSGDDGDDGEEDEWEASRRVFADAPVIPPPAEAPAPSEATSDLERAFEEGMPGDADSDAALAGTGLEASDPIGTANGDISTEMGAEAFLVAEDAAAGPPPGTSAESWRRLARSLSHEIRNPLVSIRTFTELLPEHFEDEDFGVRFTELVGRDVAHIDEVVGRLASAAAQEKIEAAPIDVSALLERLLDDRREAIGERRLLVLRELERDAPIAWGDPTSLEIALAGLLDRALASLPERGDLFVATRRIDRSADGTPRLRILLRHHDPNGRGAPELGAGDTSGVADVEATANVLEYVLAETIVEASGGQLTVDASDAQETLVLVDLRTPA